MSMIPTLQAEWREYRDAMYPKGTSAVQNRETHQAFFAGALVAFLLSNKCSELPQAEAEDALLKLMIECQQINAARAHLMKGRN